MKFTKELIEIAKTAKSAEELAELAKKNGVEISADEAKKCFDKLNTEGVLSDEELENAAGGLIWDAYTDIYCKKCDWTTKWSGRWTEKAYAGPCPVCGEKNIYAGKYHSC